MVINMKLYYMRDNHTFRALPLDVDKALAVIMEEFLAGYIYGMLCTKSTKDWRILHANGDWFEFKPLARNWLQHKINLDNFNKQLGE
jgi:hypothetical protein